MKGMNCPRCKSVLKLEQIVEDNWLCQYCGQSYPIINGIPILLNESESIFSFKDFVNQRNLFFDLSRKGKVMSLISRITPNMGGNNLGRKNTLFLEDLLLRRDLSYKPRVLIVGGSIVGDGMNDFVNSEKIEIVESDVSFGPRTKVIFDSHTIPYENESFDCVIVQAVLEHVISPTKCVSEIYRVLKPDGLVYAETPFMQQVHGGPYDFTRFSKSGHRKLFEYFDEIKSGATAGSATSFAWSYQYLLLALFGYTEKMRAAIKFFARITGFWIKYLDSLTSINPRDTDGASGFYFIGLKRNQALPDRQIIDYYLRR